MIGYFAGLRLWYGRRLGASVVRRAAISLFHPLDTIRQHLIALYGASAGAAAFTRLAALLDRAGSPARAAEGPGHLTPRDAVLITYGDQLRRPGEPPLQTLAGFARRHLAGLINTIHLLPFYPYSSDDGFSVIDFRVVDPALGDWDDIERIGPDFGLMFDAVINHVSAHSEWFRRFLQGDPAYRDWFIVVDAGVDLSKVVRPRARPLLTRFDTAAGPKSVWTTFSEDQIDLNYRNPDVLLEIIDLLLFYVSRGARLIRLDAIAYLGKTLGTACIHLPETHRVIQLFRAVLDQVAPEVLLITETNVAHVDNLSYFGDGSNEAQLVYNFALPPLVLHAFHVGTARILSGWAADLKLPSDRVTFFNFLASHDGIGVNPARGLLPDPAIAALVERAQAHGGFVSFKRNPDGARSPYELNLNYFDALSDPNSDEPLDVQVDRFMAAQAIMLALVGVPGIYVHSLLGSRGDRAGVERTGRYRSINRQKFALTPLESELADPLSLRAQVLRRYARLLQVRAAQPAFDPYGAQRVLQGNDSVFAVLRAARLDDDDVLCLHNVSARAQRFATTLPAANQAAVDLLTGERFNLDGSGRLELTLAPYQVMWLKVATEGNE
ncbi:MAG TPA: alpha-amylase family glycosyl hydrolase [Anaerolineae bacterium]|nr:alpha-amylase family glycosyl hydrolase [Anaerolineae bacterium]